MSLSYRQENQLRRVEADLRRSDPHLGAMFWMFGKLYPDQDMPASERVTTSQDRLHRAAAWIVAIAGCRIRGTTCQARIHRSGRRASTQQGADWDQESGMSGGRDG
jgi:hypothetical protein